MLKVIVSLFSLLLGIASLLVGMGALGTLLGVRAGIEQFGPPVTGVVMAAYFLGFIVGNYLCPPLIHRVGHIRAYAAMAAIVTAVALSHALVVHPLAWFVLRVVNGACMMGLYMVVESWLNAITPNERRGQVFAVYMATTLVAMAAGQYLILVGEITSMMPFALAAIFLSLGLVPVALTRIGQPVPVEVPRLSLHTLFAVAPLGAVGALFAGLATGAFWGMGPLFAHRIGLPPTGVALFMSAAILGGALLQWPIGRLSDNSDRRRVLAVVCLGAVVAALATYGFILAIPDVLYVSAFIYGGFAFTVYSLSVAHTNDHLDREQALEATRSLLLLHGIGAVIGPALAGVLMEWLGAGSLLLYFATVLALLGLYAVFRMRSRLPIIPAEPFKPMTGDTSRVVLEMDPRVDESQAEAPAA
ncbi:MAG: MFS transporter [Gammaproteobacteria bacterium HGW-Gammaproteobacteria-1]|jgi:MFS family permease|nr:MAG: MFS transporter [Gammaproteobacteria bacterium HGW-Gammaproteobacteria-1]